MYMHSSFVTHSLRDNNVEHYLHIVVLWNLLIVLLYTNDNVHSSFKNTLKHYAVLRVN